MRPVKYDVGNAFQKLTISCRLIKYLEYNQVSDQSKNLGPQSDIKSESSRKGLKFYGGRGILRS